MDFFKMENDGPELIETNFFDLQKWRNNYFLSVNAGAFRLLVPDSMVRYLGEMKTGKEVIVSRGPMEHKDCYEMMFEDNSNAPFCIHIETRAADRLLQPSDQHKKAVFDVYTRKGKVLSLPCYYRIVKRLPWLKPYTKRN